MADCEAGSGAADERRRTNRNRAADGFDVHHDDNYWNPQRFADMEQLAAAARRLAPTLVGLTVSEAQELVDQQTGLYVRFIRARGATADFGYGRITAWVRNETVTRADPG